MTSEAAGLLKAPRFRTFRKPTGKKRPVLKGRFKSLLEKRIDEQIVEAGFPSTYEKEVLKYTVPARNARYTPDWPLGDKPIFLEAKGRFRTSSERQKMILVRDQTPKVDIRFIFQNAALPIYKGSPTSHGKWATDHGFLWADKGIIPEEWFHEARSSGDRCEARLNNSKGTE